MPPLTPQLASPSADSSFARFEQDPDGEGLVQEAPPKKPAGDTPQPDPSGDALVKTPEEEPAPERKGYWCKLVGLRQATHMNGKVVSIDPELNKEGFVVITSSEDSNTEFLCKPENLAPIDGSELVAAFHEGVRRVDWRPGPTEEELKAHPGTVDAKGVLWKSTSKGRFVEPPVGYETGWEAIASAAKAFASLDAVGEREVLTRQVDAKGLEKFEMGDYSFVTYGDYFKRIEALGSGFAALPELTKGCRVVIYADTQLLWMLSAYAAWRQGLVVGTIYATLGEDGALYGLNQSEAPLVLTDGKLLKVLGKIASQCVALKRVVVFKEGDVDGGAAAACKAASIAVSTLSEIEKAGASSPAAATPPAPSDTAVLMYTSGTTGNPKGVLLTHENVAVMVAATRSPGGALGSVMMPGSRYVAYLPLAHIMELAVEVALMATGFTIGYGSTGTITPTAPKMLHENQLGDAQALKPDLFVAAPAVLDKVYANVTAKFAKLPGCLKGITDDGVESGYANFDAGGAGASGCLAPFLFKKRVAAVLGGNVKLIVTGSAPLGVTMQKFVQTVFACPVRQGYGLTETMAGTRLPSPAHLPPISRLL